MYKIQSPFYSYYYISKDDLSDCWSTKEIEQFILSYQGFVMKSLGEFNHTNVFLTIGLMMVKSHDSWSSLDYNCDKTNYVAIVTSKEVAHNT